MKATVRHMVVFNLKYPKDSEEAKQFLADSREILGSIPYASEYMQCYEISPKNTYDYGFSFDFPSPEDYERYNQDPRHVQYVNERWNNEVTQFLEIDFSEIG